MRAVLGHGLLPGLRPVRLHFGFAAERERHDRKRIQDEEGFLITTRPPKRGRSSPKLVARPADTTREGFAADRSAKLLFDERCILIGESW